MKNEKVSQIVSLIDEKYIDEATLFAPDGRRHSRGRAPARQKARRFRWGAAAACLLAALGLGSATYAYAAEAREYRTAVTFFAENDLPLEGLSRSEIKAVYRDITTRRFSYRKTTEVIRRAVPGWEIAQREPAPEDLAALWDRKNWAEPAPKEGIFFRRDFRYVRSEDRGEVLEKSLLECRRDEELLWTAEFPFYLDDWAAFPEGIAAWGWNETFSSADRTYAWIAFLDGAGSVLWQQPLNHGFQREYIASVLRNDDGTWAVISRGDGKYLCLSCFDPAGKELSFRQTEVGNYGIWNAARLGDGYILHLGSDNAGDYAHLFRMDREGNVTDEFSYEGEDCVYHITDMAEFGGQVYLSAYAVPEQRDEGGRDEIANILDYIWSKEDHGIAITSEELTPVVRENYTAVLLLCDPEGGEPQTFYSVKGSLGGKLSVNEASGLEWDVESVESTFFSPATSAFSVGGTCRVFRYTFDAGGAMTGQRDTGETVRYAR